MKVRPVNSKSFINFVSFLENVFFFNDFFYGQWYELRETPPGKKKYLLKQVPIAIDLAGLLREHLLSNICYRTSGREMKTSAGGGEGVFSSINTVKVKTVKTNFSKGLLPMLFLTLISIIEVKERRQLEMLQSFFRLWLEQDSPQAIWLKIIVWVYKQLNHVIQGSLSISLHVHLLSRKDPF